MRLRGFGVGVLALSVVQQAGMAFAQSTTTAGATQPAASATSLPAINVDAPARHGKPKAQAKREARQPQSSQARNVNPTPAAPQTAAAPSGAPNIGSGPAQGQSMASEVVIIGEAINARPVTRPGEVLEACLLYTSPSPRD